jgi:hypothetical protein
MSHFNQDIELKTDFEPPQKHAFHTPLPPRNGAKYQLAGQEPFSVSKYGAMDMIKSQIPVAILAYSWVGKIINIETDLSDSMSARLSGYTGCHFSWGTPPKLVFLSCQPFFLLFAFEKISPRLTAPLGGTRGVLRFLLTLFLILRAGSL